MPGGAKSTQQRPRNVNVAQIVSRLSASALWIMGGSG
jgi:hypothetical protein